MLESEEGNGTRTFVIYKGALPKDHKLGDKEKTERTKFFLQERSWPLDPPANERPFFSPLQKNKISKAVLNQ